MVWSLSLVDEMNESLQLIIEWSIIHCHLTSDALGVDLNLSVQGLDKMISRMAREQG